MANTVFPKGAEKILSGDMQSFQPTKILRARAVGVLA